jgi:hypothetical protein
MGTPQPFACRPAAGALIVEDRDEYVMSGGRRYLADDEPRCGGAPVGKRLVDKCPGVDDAMWESGRRANNRSRDSQHHQNDGRNSPRAADAFSFATHLIVIGG